MGREGKRVFGEVEYKDQYLTQMSVVFDSNSIGMFWFQGHKIKVTMQNQKRSDGPHLISLTKAHLLMCLIWHNGI